MRKIIILIALIILGVIHIPCYSQISYTVINPQFTVTMPDSIDVNYYNINLDSDNSIDFRIGARYKITMEHSWRIFDFHYVFIESLNENKINVGPYFDGDTISSSIKFHKINWIYGYGQEYDGFVGSWPYSVETVDTFAYVALQFRQNNNIHYGWVKLKSDRESFTVDSFGWNQVPNQPILAGQTF